MMYQKKKKHENGNEVNKKIKIKTNRPSEEKIFSAVCWKALQMKELHPSVLSSVKGETQDWETASEPEQLNVRSLWCLMLHLSTLQL